MKATKFQELNTCKCNCEMTMKLQLAPRTNRS